jgi:DNA invertase Pin-like site-specific DNA recombinase
MATRDEAVEIPVDGRGIPGTVVAPAAAISGMLFVQEWGNRQEVYLPRARQIAALDCVGLTFEPGGLASASGKRDGRPGLEACLEGLHPGDTLVAWKLDRLGRDLRHLVDLVHGLTGRGVGLRVLAGEGAAIDTAAPDGRPVSGVFAALAEFERGRSSSGPGRAWPPRAPAAAPGGGRTN